MKRGLVLALSLALVLAVSSMGLAASFSADASYLLGKNGEGEDAVDERGFMVGAAAEVYPNLVIDGRYLNASFELDENDGGGSMTQSWLSGSASYRILQQDDFEVLIGGGYQVYNLVAKTDAGATNGDSSGEDALTAAGIFGKITVALSPIEKLRIVGDVSYGPSMQRKQKIDGVEQDEKKDALLMGRVSISYELMDNVSVQATAVRNSLSEEGIVNLLYGGGITLTF